MRKFAASVVLVCSFVALAAVFVPVASADPPLGSIYCAHLFPLNYTPAPQKVPDGSPVGLCFVIPNA